MARTIKRRIGFRIVSIIIVCRVRNTIGASRWFRRRGCIGLDLFDVSAFCPFLEGFMTKGKSAEEASVGEGVCEGFFFLGGDAVFDARFVAFAKGVDVFVVGDFGGWGVGGMVVGFGLGWFVAAMEGVGNKDEGWEAGGVPFDGDLVSMQG